MGRIITANYERSVALVGVWYVILQNNKFRYGIRETIANYVIHIIVIFFYMVMVILHSVNFLYEN